MKFDFTQKVREMIEPSAINKEGRKDMSYLFLKLVSTNCFLKLVSPKRATSQEVSGMRHSYLVPPKRLKRGI